MLAPAVTPRFPALLNDKNAEPSEDDSAFSGIIAYTYAFGSRLALS